MGQKHDPAGHAAAAVTVTVWGTTFISTKVLLESFTPIEILLIRFVLGLAVLCVLSPHRLRLTDRRQEGLFAAAGLTGVCIYYLMENIALSYASASSIGVIVSSAPLFTGIFAALFLKEEKLHPRFFAGFAAAMIGIALISFGGGEDAAFSLVGDLMALAAAMAWGAYSILTRRISAYGYPTLAVTKRIFCWGVLFMLPGALAMGFHPPVEELLQPRGLLNLLYLGVCASAGCFVLWNFAVRRLGALRTSVYIYATPAVTVVMAWVLLGERLTLLSALGTVLVIAGLLLSEGKSRKGAGNGRSAENVGQA